MEKRFKLNETYRDSRGQYKVLYIGTGTCMLEVVLEYDSYRWLNKLSYSNIVTCYKMKIYYEEVEYRQKI